MEAGALNPNLWSFPLIVEKICNSTVVLQWIEKRKKNHNLYAWSSVYLIKLFLLFSLGEMILGVNK